MLVCLCIFYMWMHIFRPFIIQTFFRVVLVFNLLYIYCIGTRHSISVKLQSEAVDIYMKLCRYKEEEQQVLSEMMSFLAYLKEIILAGLSLSLTGTYVL